MSMWAVMKNVRFDLCVRVCIQKSTELHTHSHSLSVGLLLISVEISPHKIKIRPVYGHVYLCV